MDAIVVVNFSRHGRHRVLRVAVYAGRTGELASSGGYRLRGGQLRADSQQTILRRIAAAARGGRGRGGDQVAAVRPSEVSVPGGVEPVAPVEAEVGGQHGDYAEVEMRAGSRPSSGRTGRGRSRAHYAARGREAPSREPRAEPSQGHEPRGHSAREAHGHERRGHTSHAAHGHDAHQHDAHAHSGHDAHGHGEHGHDEHGGDEHGHGAHGGGGAERSHSAGFYVAAGLGFGQHLTDFPTQEGSESLDTGLHAATRAEIGGYVRPNPGSRLIVDVSARYTTSLFLTVQQAGQSTTGMRTQHLTFDVGANLPLAEGERHVEIRLEAGWNFRFLHPDLQIAALPDIPLHGVYGRAGVYFRPFAAPVAIGLHFEFGHMASLNPALNRLAGVSDGIQLGGEGHIDWEISQQFHAGIVYRESHALLGSVLGDTMSDVERYGIAKLSYAF